MRRNVTVAALSLAFPLCASATWMMEPAFPRAEVSGGSEAPPVLGIYAADFINPGTGAPEPFNLAVERDPNVDAFWGDANNEGQIGLSDIFAVTEVPEDGSTMLFSESRVEIVFCFTTKRGRSRISANDRFLGGASEGRVGLGRVGPSLDVHLQPE